ncbi:hypothetical protein ACFSCZ_14930 [Siminovitchia sediminis]|uniref:Uncharacterized protein n=1 Tax=Siminovitchia sediminis TaxID=1274353 RepID=A0ABW4KIN8_9BACI
MKKFNRMIIDQDEYPSRGAYLEINDGLEVELANHSISEHLIRLMHERTFIQSIRFQGGDADDVYEGEFMITRTDGNTITLKKV